MKKTRKNLFTYSLNHFFTSQKPAFTLTEVLVALTIVGVISALVLPAIVTRYQEKAFDSAYKRETQVIESAVDELVVSENTASFFDTMMYKDVEPENYDDSSKVFINKYLRASKICSTASDCFAKKYYKYEDNDKKVYTPEFKGTCAKLKNGASICITPQIGGVPVKGIIDINGDKGPNVLGKDLRAFAFTTWTRYGKNNEVAEVLDTPFEPIGGGTSDLCEGLTCGCGDLPECEIGCSTNPNEWNIDCCQDNISSIIGPSHHCCSYTVIKNTVNACSECGNRILIEGLGYIELLGLSIAIDTTQPEYKQYDTDCQNSKACSDALHNHFAGAKLMCEQKGMILPDKDTLQFIHNTHTACLPTHGFFWSSSPDDTGSSAHNERVYGVRFEKGSFAMNFKGNSGGYVMCVEN